MIPLESRHHHVTVSLTTPPIHNASHQLVGSTPVEPLQPVGDHPVHDEVSDLRGWWTFEHYKTRVCVLVIAVVV